MGKNGELNVLFNLYFNMKGSFHEIGSKSDSLDYDESLRVSLTKAEELGLMWQEFYEVQKGLVGKVRDSQMVRKFPADKKIDLGDFSEAQKYFEGNLA